MELVVISTLRPLNSLEKESMVPIITPMLYAEMVSIIIIKKNSYYLNGMCTFRDLSQNIAS
jgi:hypothetical protein